MREFIKKLEDFVTPRIYSNRDNYVIYWLNWELVIGKGRQQ